MDVETIPRPVDASQSLIFQLLQKARTNLIETGSRNRLVHHPKGSGRTKSIEIIDEVADEIFRTLLRDARAMSFLPGKTAETAEEKPIEEGIYIPPPQNGGADGAASRHTDTKLQTRLTPEGLQQRLLGLFRDARTLEEEQGVNVLYLALGFLHWYEAPSSDIQRHAPLILLPVELVRDSARSAFKLRFREEDLSANIALEQRLKLDFGITLPSLPDDDEWTPTAYFSAVNQAVQSQPRWVVEPSSITLGLFSFAKLVMYLDLDPQNWPDQKLADHPLIRRLMADGFPPEEPLFPDDVRLDEILHPSNTIHVVDADASQSLVIETVCRGRNLVVQGPPGTGKSQTIANIIAAAVHSGKKVLFIAEKLAALNVVRSRLARIGLSPICLELHSRSANKRAVLEDLKRTLESAPQAVNGQSIIDALATARDKLNSECAILNTPLAPSGVTPYRALGTQVLLSSAGCPPPELDLPEAGSWTEDQTEQIAVLLEQYVDLAKAAGLRSKHPWRGTHARGLQPADQQRLLTGIEDMRATAEGLAKAVTNASTFLGCDDKHSLGEVTVIAKVLRLLLERPEGAENFIAAILTSKEPKRLAELAQEGQKLQALSTELAILFVDSAWNANASRIRNDLAAKGSSTFGRLSGTYRSAQKELRSLLKVAPPAQLEERLKYLDLLIEAQKLKSFLRGEEAYAARAIGPLWRSDRTDFRLLGSAIVWLGAVKELRVPVSTTLLSAPLPLDQIAPFADYLDQAVVEVRSMLEECSRKLDLDFRECFEVSTMEEVACLDIAARYTAWLGAGERLDEWTRLNIAEDAIREYSAGSVVEAIATGKLPLDRAITEVLYTRAEQIWKAAIAHHPQLALLDGEQRSRLVEQFKDLEVKRRSIAIKEVLSCHAQEMPRGSVGEMGTIRSEIARKRGHMPVRKLMQRAGRKLQEIKPVMLMSPLSVAQFLPPGSVEFDLLLMDEASQVKPEDALGAIARAKQVVVVGDNQQLPPTSFFDRMISGDQEPDEELEQAGLANTADLESILKLCEARGMPGRMLTWHYRSRHPSLIEVSNHQFYENRLFLPPAPVYGPGHNGFFVRRVSGSYDRGGSRTNRVEADAIVAGIASHARTTPERTLGIVTFSIPQKTLIEDLLEVARRQDPLLESFLTTSETGESVFVKNLENVQGDERDVIMVSVGYGPRTSGAGLDSMGFGPVSSDGGERRLNVLFTRARFKCEVFVSFASGDIDLARTTQLGPAVLKRFLKFGETGFLDVPAALGGHDSPFEEAVAVAIAEMGYEVDAQVGSAGFRIDLAVKHPDQPGSYLMAIECDGAAYHSARWARERDRLRQQVLEDLGWRFHRIWSTDWFRRMGEERRRLKARLDAARLANPVRPPEPTPELSIEIPPASAPTAIQAEEPSFPAYIEAIVAVDVTREPHELSLQAMASTVAEIVQAEGPVHEDEIARRVARAYGKDRTGSRILEAVLKGLRRNRDSGILESAGPFWHGKPQTECQVRNRANASLTLKRGDMVPPMEIEVAIEFAFDHNGSMTEDQLVVAVSRLFGFDRAGPEFKVATNKTIADLIQRGTIKVQDDILSIPHTSPQAE